MLIDKGKVAFVGAPYGAEAAVEKALGLESSPATLLTVWLDTLKTADKAQQRTALERLVEKAPADFDLCAWAMANGGGEAPVEAGGAVPVEAGARGGDADGMDLLKKCVTAWPKQDGKQRTAMLQQLGEQGPVSFDLGQFARQAFGKAYPLVAKELQQLLKDQKYVDVIEAIAQRNPAPAVLATAVKDARLKDWCRGKTAEIRAMARKGLMVQTWVFGGVPPKDNEAFWRDLSVSGMATSPDRKQITGVLLGGASVTREMIEGFIQGHFSQALIMDALEAGRTPPGKDLAKRVAAERQKVQQELEARYGDPKEGK